MRKIKKIYIHISDSFWGTDKDIKDWHTWPKELENKTLKYMGEYYASDDDLPEEVRGKRGNGWMLPGYHYVIEGPYPTYESWANKRPVPDNDGKIKEMLPHGQIGSHVYGENGESLGIVIVAKSDHETGRGVITGSQMKKARRLVKSLIARYPGAEVWGHYEHDDRKSYCPCIDMTWFRRYIHTNQSR